MLRKHFSVAIDGPSGAGKSTLAKEAASKLGATYVDTGAIYRTIGLAAFQRGIEPKDEPSVRAMLPQLSIRLSRGDDGLQRMELNGEDVTDRIRLPEISMYASGVSSLPCVREYLLEMQRDLARSESVIMDGRDIGTVVLPDADVKIYLTASAEVRAKRRCLELSQRGTPKPFEEVLIEINERDRADMTRPIAPLRRAEGAILLDTSEIGFEESLALLMNTIREQLNA